jgi:hypothetical protein
MSASEHISHPQFNPENKFYGEMSEMVPISLLKQMRGNELRTGPEYIQSLAESIQKEGLRMPGAIEYYQEGRTAYMGEGHHRLAALESLGHTHMPMTVFRHESEDSRKRGIQVRGKDPNRFDYVPGNMKPSDIMDF